MPQTPSTIERILPEVGGNAVTVAEAVDAPWGLGEKLIKVTGTIEYFGRAGWVLVFQVNMPEDDITNASSALGIHDMTPLGPGKTNTESEVVFYVPLSPSLPREKIRVDQDGYQPENCEVFWIDASEAIFAPPAEEPDEVESVYKLTKKVTGAPFVGNEFRIDVTMATAVLGNTPLEGVRFRYHFELPSETAHAAVRSADGTEFEDDGFWGPAGGFDIPAQYNSTSAFWVTLSEAGEYTVTLELFRVADDEVLLTVTDKYEAIASGS